MPNQPSGFISWSYFSGCLQPCTAPSLLSLPPVLQMLLSSTDIHFPLLQATSPMLPSFSPLFNLLHRSAILSIHISVQKAFDQYKNPVIYQIKPSHVYWNDGVKLYKNMNHTAGAVVALSACAWLRKKTQKSISSCISSAWMLAEYFRRHGVLKYQLKNLCDLSKIFASANNQYSKFIQGTDCGTKCLQCIYTIMLG